MAWKRTGPWGTRGMRTWSASYVALTTGGYTPRTEGDMKKGFAFAFSSRPDNRVPSRTTPGEFGARASKLYQMLKKGHHGVKLTDDEMKRITLWLDCNSNFFGVYHDLEKQIKGHVVEPLIE